MAFGIEGERIRLVPRDKAKHLEHAYAWINDTDVTDWIGASGTPMTRGQEETWFDAIDPNSVHWAIETLQGECVGFGSLMEIDYRNGTAVSGSFLGPSAQGRGYGTESCRLRSVYARYRLGLRMLYSGCFDTNDRSRRMLEKTGFVLYGRKPKAVWRQGAFRDELLFALDLSTLDPHQTEKIVL